ncbi:RNase H domain-containing protein [Trichonephila clavipes]|nr:RNase H domain-containing protein [Trichonephila clavipes]
MPDEEVINKGKTRKGEERVQINPCHWRSWVADPDVHKKLTYTKNGAKEKMEILSASSISNYDCILSPFFILHPSERNAINIVHFSDKSTEDFPVICYTDGSKIDGSVGFFRSGVESENFQFRIRDECTVFVAELLCLNFAVKWITEQNSVISEYLICTDSLSSLDSLKCISSSNNIIVEIQKQLKSLRDKNISIDFAFVRGHTGVLGNERTDWLAKAATKRKIDIDVNIPKSFYKKITNEIMLNCQVIYSQFGLAIHENDHQARRRFVEWVQNEIAVVPDFHKRILFSDEAHFWLNGYVNKQNCRIWSETNPQVYVETPLHPEKLTGALYGLVESLARTSSKTMKVTTLQSMVIGIEP